MQNLLRPWLCRRIVILLGIAAQIQSPLSICKERTILQSGSTTRCHYCDVQLLNSDPITVHKDSAPCKLQHDSPFQRRRDGILWLSQRWRGWGQAELGDGTVTKTVSPSWSLPGTVPSPPLNDTSNMPSVRWCASSSLYFSTFVRCYFKAHITVSKRQP